MCVSASLSRTNVVFFASIVHVSISRKLSAACDDLTGWSQPKKQNEDIRYKQHAQENTHVFALAPPRICLISVLRPYLS